MFQMHGRLWKLIPSLVCTKPQRWSAQGCSSVILRWKGGPTTTFYIRGVSGGLLYQLVRTMQEQHSIDEAKMDDDLEDYHNDIDLDMLMLEKTTEEAKSEL